MAVASFIFVPTLYLLTPLWLRPNKKMQLMVGISPPMDLHIEQCEKKIFLECSHLTHSLNMRFHVANCNIFQDMN